MKKIIAVFLAVAGMLCLCSCKINSKKGEETTTTTTTIPAEEASHLANNIEKGRFGTFDDYSDEDKKKIQEYAEKDGYTLVYNEDGSGTLSNEEGTWFVGKGWVDNEYTDGVPAIDFGKITMSSELEEKEDKFYMFLVKETSAYRTVEYIDDLIEAGFAEVGENERDADAGVVTFIGENESGKHIEVAYSSNGMTVKIQISK